MFATSSNEENEKIRASHHERSRNFVLTNLKDLLNGSERYIVGEICYAHRDSVPIKRVEKTKIIRHPSLGNQTVRVQFLAALVRVADTFDLCHTRISDNLDDVVKFPPQAAFFHALHERLSGIDFDKEGQSIFLDFNICSAKEKQICMKYVVHDTQRTLDSVRDCLISNRIIYTTVVPKFSVTNAGQSKLQVPKKVKNVKNLSMTTQTEIDLLKTKAWKSFTAQKFEDSIDLCNKGLAINEKDPSLLYLKAAASEQQGDFPQATEFYEKCVDSDPEETMFSNAAGNFFGEVLLDIPKSFQYFEMAYKLLPSDDITVLNYSEALVTVGKFQEAYDLMSKYWANSTDFFKAINAKFIEAHSLIFMDKKDDGLKTVGNSVLFA